MSERVATLGNMRRKLTIVLLTLLLLASTAVRAAEDEPPRKIRTPRGQVKIMSINARQNGVLGLKRFEDMYELSHAVRRRPLAFNGGVNGAVAAPDVLAMQEVRSSNAEIFEHLLRQRFKVKYRLVGFEDAASQMVYNPETVTPAGEVVTWEDVCSDRSPGRRDDRFYQFARFTENKTDAPFVVAAVHIPKNFRETDAVNCYVDNLEEVRDQLEAESGAVFIVGDFNRRAVELQHECDPNETSSSAPWYASMTSGDDDNRAYADAVRDDFRARGASMSNQWTHEQKAESVSCAGDSRFRRARIDYLFYANAVVAEASVDTPGWAGESPGARHPSNHKYSDHRFVQGRFVIEGPPRPLLPEVQRGLRGNLEITWQPVEGATGYVLYRATTGDYSVLARLDATTTTYVDTATLHALTYRYSVAPLGEDSSQGLESRPGRETVDARGPQIVSVTPGRGATFVDIRSNIRIVFDERVRPESVRQDRIRLFRGSKRLSGELRQVEPRVLVFDPAFPLWKGMLHRVVTKPLQDRYQNVGSTTSWSFTTEPKKRKGRKN
jgi:endonuclease/exonuclease/phosphatase family metal-dependent hydrolase